MSPAREDASLAGRPPPPLVPPSEQGLVVRPRNDDELVSARRGEEGQRRRLGSGAGAGVDGASVTSHRERASRGGSPAYGG